MNEFFLKVLLECGAKDTNLIVIKGQIWRLPASMFLHGGIAHLVLNMIGVNSVAKPLEEDFGFFFSFESKQCYSISIEI